MVTTPARTMLESMYATQRAKGSPIYGGGMGVILRKRPGRRLRPLKAWGLRRQAWRSS